MKFFVIAAMLLLQTISAEPVVVESFENEGGVSTLPACTPIKPEEKSMKCMCVVLNERRYDPLEKMYTGSGENVVDVLLEACRLDHDAEIELDRECYRIRTNPLLEDLLRLDYGQLPQTMEYNPMIGVDLSWVDDCLDFALAQPNFSP